jgi:hypothetical protein
MVIQFNYDIKLNIDSKFYSQSQSIQSEEDLLKTPPVSDEEESSDDNLATNVDELNNSASKMKIADEIPEHADEIPEHAESEQESTTLNRGKIYKKYLLFNANLKNSTAQRRGMKNRRNESNELDQSVAHPNKKAANNKSQTPQTSTSTQSNKNGTIKKTFNSESNQSSNDLKNRLRSRNSLSTDNSMKTSTPEASLHGESRVDTSQGTSNASSNRAAFNNTLENSVHINESEMRRLAEIDLNNRELQRINRSIEELVHRREIFTNTSNITLVNNRVNPRPTAGEANAYELLGNPGSDPLQQRIDEIVRMQVERNMAIFQEQNARISQPQNMDIDPPIILNQAAANVNVGPQIQAPIEQNNILGLNGNIGNEIHDGIHNKIIQFLTAPVRNNAMQDEEAQRRERVAQALQQLNNYRHYQPGSVLRSLHVMYARAVVVSSTQYNMESFDDADYLSIEQTITSSVALTQFDQQQGGIIQFIRHYGSLVVVCDTDETLRNLLVIDQIGLVVGRHTLAMSRFNDNTYQNMITVRTQMCGVDITWFMQILADRNQNLRIEEWRSIGQPNGRLVNMRSNSPTWIFEFVIPSDVRIVLLSTAINFQTRLHTDYGYVTVSFATQRFINSRNFNPPMRFIEAILRETRMIYNPAIGIMSEEDAARARGRNRNNPYQRPQ